jgi:type II secretory pathway pseudopilin PulG
MEQQQQYIPVPQQVSAQQLPQMQTMMLPQQQQQQQQQPAELTLAGYGPSTLETPKSLLNEMPFTPLTPNTSAVIESIMNGATTAPPRQHQPNQQIPSINQQLLQQQLNQQQHQHQQPYHNQGMLPQHLGSQAEMQYMQQNPALLQQQLQQQMMQQQPSMQQQQQYQQYQPSINSGKRKSFDAGINRDDDSPSTKRRKSSGMGLSIVVPDTSNQPALRRVEQDNSQAIQQQQQQQQQQQSDDNEMFTAPQPIDKNKLHSVGNSSENLTPMNSGVFSPTDEKSPMPLHLTTPTSLSAMEWPSPTSAFCSLSSKNKKDIISS